MSSRSTGRILLKCEIQASHRVRGTELRIGAEVSTAIRAADRIPERVPEEVTTRKFWDPTTWQPFVPNDDRRRYGTAGGGEYSTY
jgi:hypothetical protein